MNPLPQHDHAALFSPEISPVENQDLGGLLLLHQRRPERAARPRRALCPHGPVHDRRHQVSEQWPNRDSLLDFKITKSRITNCKPV